MHNAESERRRTGKRKPHGTAGLQTPAGEIISGFHDARTHAHVGRRRRGRSKQAVDVVVRVRHDGLLIAARVRRALVLLEDPSVPASALPAARAYAVRRPSPSIVKKSGR
jgi:hypothetical protein